MDPRIWEDQKNYCKALKIAQRFEVVNVHAGISLATINEYKGKMTYSEVQPQFLLQMFENIS